MENEPVVPKHSANPYENFDQWFNNTLFSDLNVFISTDSGSTYFTCHKFIIQRRSPSFLEDLLTRKFEENNSSSNIDSVTIIPELQNDADLTRLFLSMFYMGHEAYTAIQYNIASKHKDMLIELCEKYGLYCAFKPPKPAFETIKVTVPVPRRRTPNGDIVISIKGTNNNFLCHKMVLVHYSDYFQAMFTSEMKESSAQQIVLDVTGYMEDEHKTPLFQLFLESLYTGNEPKFPSIELAMHGDQLAEQYFCPVFAKHCMNFLNKQMTPKTIVEFISTALRLERHDLVELATDYFIPNIVTIALQDNFSLLPLEYILNLEFDFKNTIYHHCILESSNDNACLNAIKKLEEMIGKDSRVNILANNANYDSTIHLAAYSARPKTLQYLIKRGVDVNEINAKDLTALDYVLANKFHKKWIPIVNILVDHGAQSKPEDPEVVYQYAAQCNPFFDQHKDLWPKYVQLLAENPPKPGPDHKFEQEYEQHSLKWFQEPLNLRNFTMVKTLVQQLKVPLLMKVNIKYNGFDNEKAKIQIEENGECSIAFHSTFGGLKSIIHLHTIDLNINFNLSAELWRQKFLFQYPVGSTYCIVQWRFEAMHKIPFSWKKYHIGKIGSVSEEFMSSKHGSNFIAAVESSNFSLTLYNEEKHDHFVVVCDKKDTACINFLWYLWIDQNVKEENKARMFLQEIPPDETLPSGIASDPLSIQQRVGFWVTFPLFLVNDLSQETKDSSGCKIC